MSSPLTRVALVGTLLATACIGADPTASYVGADSYESVQVGPVRRWYRLHIPEHPVRGPRAPLILAFHGYGQTNERLEQVTGLSTAADAAGAIVAYPESYYSSWDVTGDLETELQVRDIDYVRAIIARVSADHVVDRDKVVAVGMSNGAVFVQRLACVAADEIAGFVAVAGLMLRPVAESCQPIRPVSAMYILGADDATFPEAGGGVLLSLDSALELWADVDGCGSTRTTVLPDTAHDGTQAALKAYSGCDHGTSVSRVLISGAGHSWPGQSSPPNPEGSGRTSRNFNATRAVLDFAAGVRR